MVYWVTPVKNLVFAVFLTSYFAVSTFYDKEFCVRYLSVFLGRCDPFIREKVRLCILTAILFPENAFFVSLAILLIL